MAKAVGSMVMHMTVDDSRVTPAINTMKKELRDLNATWRANVEAAKAAGDSQEAARAKAEGLALSMAKQKEILDTMNAVMRNTGERTNDIANEYDRMASSITRAEAQYRNLTNQEQAALVILDKQETGIDELNRSIEANEKLTQSQIQSLKLQGDEYGANSLKVDSLKNKQKQLQEVQEKEEQILKKIVDRSGEGSRAYVEQSAAVQSAKNKIVENNAELSKYNGRIESTSVKLKELKSSYHSIKDSQDSYITRLKAEGRQNEANVADINKLKSAYANLSEQYKLQMTQLNSSSVGSKGYQEAYVAANKTATEMARVATQSKNTQKEINRMNPYGFSKIGTALNGVGNAGDSMGKKVVGAYQAIRRNAATVALSVGIVGGTLLKGAQTASDIENSYIKTNNLLVTGGEKQKNVTQQVAQMQKDGAKYATEYGYSQKNISDGYQDLVKRGYDGAQSIGSMKSLMEAARASGDDYGDVVRNTTTALENFGLRSDDTATMMQNTKLVTNQMAFAADMTATDFQSLGKAMEYVGSSAHQSGFDLSETASAIGVLSNNGLEADKAGTGLRKVINSLQSPTKTAQGALSELGLSTQDFIDKSGKMKSMTDIFELLNQHTSQLSQSQQGSVFHALFGTTGQTAGSILASNADQLGKLNDKVKESADGQGYVHTLAQKNMQTTKARLEQLQAILEKVSMSIGEAMLPAINKAAKAIQDAFNSKEGQEALKNTAKAIGNITSKAVDLFIFMGQHIGAVKAFAIAFGSIWAIGKIGKTITMIKNLNDTLKITKALSAFSIGGSSIKGGAGKIATTTAGGSVASAGEGVAVDAAMSRALGAGGGKGTTSFLSKLIPSASKMAPIASKIVAPLGVAIAGMDVGGSVIKAFSTKKSSDAYKAAGKTGGTAIGAGIGGILGSVIPGIGTVAGGLLGASIGDALGSTKTAQSIAKKFHDAFKHHPLKAEYDVKPKTEDTKKAYEDLNKSAQKYYTDKQKQDKKDLDVLLKNGYITKQQYDERLQAANDEAKKASKIEKLSSADRAAVAKYYAQQKQKVEEQYNKQKQKTASKWNKQIDKDEHIYGANSVQVQEDFAKKKKAIAQDESDKKKALGKLTLKNATQTTVAEAKLHTTLDGKIKLSSADQLKTLKKLTSEKGKLSKKQLNTLESDAKKEYNTVKDNADKKYKEVTDSNYKQAKKVIDAANRQYKDVKKAAEDQYNDTVKASKSQFKGNSQWARDQRSAIESQARKQRDNTIDAAGKQKDGIISKAGDQWREADEKAKKQHDDVVDKARKQKNDTVKEAENQKNHIVDKFDKQKKATVRTSTQQNNSILSGFTSFWNGMTGKSRNGMGWLVGPINAGIKALNSLMHSFGAGNNTIQPLPTKFATGTGLFSNARRPITKPTLAMLNDGFDSPETGNKEMLIHPNGQSEIVEGQNTQRLLMPGTEVLNATETKLYHQMMGIQHFSSGTGIFSKIWGSIKGAGSVVADVAGDVWDGMKDGVEKFTKMFSFITDAVSHPIKTLEKKFNPKRDGDNGSVFNNLADFVSFKPLKKQATDWWKELWSMANDASESGSSAGNKGDDYLFKNKGADAGTDPWGYYFKECVSFVASRLKNMGVSPSLFTGLGNGSDWVHAKVKHTNKPKPGDVAVYAAGSDYGNHVAMVSSVQGGKISGEEYNFLPTAAHKYHTYSGRPISGATTFLDFGRSYSGSDSNKETKANGPLQKLIKSEVGGMFKWIQKYIAPLNDDDGEAGVTALPKGSHKNWLKQAGAEGDFSKWNYIINHESSWNPKAKNPGSDAYGIGQALPPSKMAKFGGDYMSNPITQLKWMKSYVNERYGGIDGAYDFWKSHHWYANGGLVTKHQVAEIGEGNKPEMIIPLDGLKSSRGYELLGKTMTAMAVRDNLASQPTNADGLEKLEDKFDSVIQLLGKLVQGQANPAQIKAVVDKNDLYRKQAQDTNLRNYQSL